MSRREMLRCSELQPLTYAPMPTATALCAYCRYYGGQAFWASNHGQGVYQLDMDSIDLYAARGRPSFVFV